MIGQAVHVIFLITDHGSLVQPRVPKIVRLRQGYGATAPKAFGAGGKGIRTPDFQLAKLALYQLSYAPVVIADFRLWIADWQI